MILLLRAFQNFNAGLLWKTSEPEAARETEQTRKQYLISMAKGDKEVPLIETGRDTWSAFPRGAVFFAPGGFRLKDGVVHFIGLREIS